MRPKRSLTTITVSGRFTVQDMAIVEAVRQKLGIRSATEVLRVGLRSLAREHDLAIPANQPNSP
jgi:hypothetical protein